MMASKLSFVALWFLTAFGATAAFGDGRPLPADLQAVLDKPLYKNGVWGLRVVDLDTGEVVYDLKPERKFMTGSVRKLFSVGLALDKLGAEHKIRDADLSERHGRGWRPHGRSDPGRQRRSLDGRANEPGRHAGHCRLRSQ